VPLRSVDPEATEELGVPKKALISIVDDDESMRMALKGLMRSLGYAAEAFASAEGFISSRHVHRTACLIVDVNMPGMSGPKLHEHLVNTGTPIPTILITAYPNEEVRSRALSAGVAGYFTKPFDENVFLDCIRSALKTS
jgi:FixJ family two-component response regulator